MKKLFFCLIVTTLFSVNGFAEDNKNLITTSKQVKLAQVDNLGFCGVRVVTSYIDDSGNVLGTTEEFVWLGISTNTAACQEMIKNYANSIGGTIH